MVWKNAGRFEAQHIFDGGAPQTALRIPTYLTTALNQLPTIRALPAEYFLTVVVVRSAYRNSPVQTFAGLSGKTPTERDQQTIAPIPARSMSRECRN
jgi:hypothetical protein